MKPVEKETALGSYEALEREAMSSAESQGGVLKPVESFEGEDPNAPFAGDIARPNSRGEIEFKPQALRKWLAGVPEAQRPAAVKALVTEEMNHVATRQAVGDKGAATFWNDLTGLEKRAHHRRYTEYWTPEALNEATGRKFSESQLGHEAINSFLMRARRMPLREFVEAAGREKWTVATLDNLANIVFKTREFLGTKASREQLSMLDDIAGKITAARAAAQKQDEQGPAAFQKGEEEKKARDLLDMSPADLSKWKFEAKYGPELMQQMASTVTPEDMPKLIAERDRLRAKNTEQMLDWESKGIPDAAGQKDFFETQLKAQTLNEMIEHAPKEGEGPAAFQKKRGEPKQDKFFEDVTAMGKPGQVGKAEVVGPGKGVPESEAGTARPTAEDMQEVLGKFYPPSTGVDIEHAAGDMLGIPRKERAPEPGKPSPQPEKTEPPSAKPSFEEFLDASQKKWGPFVTPSQLLDVWNDQVAKIAEMPGRGVERMRKALNLEHNLGARQIADPTPAPVEIAPGEERAAAQRLDSAQRYRRNVIANIITKLTPDASKLYGKKGVLKPVDRKSISLDDIAWHRGLANEVFSNITQDEARRPDMLGQILTRDARVFGQPVSVSKRVAVFVDQKNGKVHAVSAYNDGRRGPVVVDPRSVSKAAPVIELDRIKPTDYRAIYGITVEPVQGLHQTWDSIKAFNEDIGNKANEFSRSEMGRVGSVPASGWW